MKFKKLGVFFIAIFFSGTDLMSKSILLEITIEEPLLKKIKKEHIQDFVDKFGEAMAEKNLENFFALIADSGRNAGIEHWYGFIPKKTLKKDFEKYSKMKEEEIEKLTKKQRFVEDIGYIPITSTADLYLNLFSDKERQRIEQKVNWNDKEPFRFFSPSYLFKRDPKCEIYAFDPNDEKVYPGIAFTLSFSLKSKITFRVNPIDFKIIAISWGEKLP